MPRFFQRSKKRKLKDNEVQEPTPTPDGVRNIDDIADVISEEFDEREHSFLRRYRTNRTREDDAVDGTAHRESGVLSNTTSSIPRGAHEMYTNQSIHLKRTSPRRASGTSVKTSAFPRNTPRTASANSNFAAIQNVSLEINKENQELRFQREHSIRRIKYLEHQLESSESTKTKLARNLETTQCINEDYAKVLRNLYTENQSLRFIASTGTDAEAMKQKDELLRKESLKNAKLERNVVDICQLLDKIDVRDGKVHKRQSRIYEELKSIGQKLTNGQEDIKVQLAMQNSLTDKCFLHTQKLIEEVGKLQDNGSTAEARDDTTSWNETLHTRCSDSVKELCVHLMKLIGAKWPTFAVAIGVPPDVVGDMNNNRPSRLSFENMFLKIISVATRYEELSMSRLLMACRAIGVNPYRDKPISSIHEEVLRRKAERLTNGLHPASVLAKLRDSMVVTASEIEYILETDAHSQQVQRLMDVLPFLGETGFNALLDALKATGDKYLAEELQYEETLLTQRNAGGVEDDMPMLDFATPCQSPANTLDRPLLQREELSQGMAALIKAQADMKTKVFEISAILEEKEKRVGQFV